MRLLPYTLILLVFILSSMRLVNTQAESSCNTCCQGPSGIPGSPGHNGFPGRDGLRGEQGDSAMRIMGDKGDRGEAGLPGTEGPQADSGVSGLRGLPGKMGPRGPVGSEGPIGPSSQKGQKGDSSHVLLTRRSAFTAVKTNSQIGIVGEMVTFQEVPTNIGNHFSLSTNIFICQHPGTYIFMFSIGVGAASDPIVLLVKNGNPVVGAGTRTDPESSLGQGTNSAILNLEVGDQVWLEFSNYDGRRVFSDRHRFTSFSGILFYDS